MTQKISCTTQHEPVLFKKLYDFNQRKTAGFLISCLINENTLSAHDCHDSCEARSQLAEPEPEVYREV